MLLEGLGWERVGKGHSYEYLRVPQGQKVSRPVVSLYVPTDDEVVRLGAAALGGRPIPASIGLWTTRISKSEKGASFSFGNVDPSWSLTLRWNDLSETPTFFRSGKEPDLNPEPEVPDDLGIVGKILVVDENSSTSDGCPLSISFSARRRNS